MSTSPDPTERRHTDVRAALVDHSFATLATSSAENRPHVAGVLYTLVDRDLYVHTDRDSRKARNIAENPRVAVCVPVPDGSGAPPFTVTAQGVATLLDLDDPQVTTLIDGGRLKAITSHGELERPDSCFVKISPGRRLATYGIGVSEAEIAADPLSAFGSVEW